MLASVHFLEVYRKVVPYVAIIGIQSPIHAVHFFIVEPSMLECETQEFQLFYLFTLNLNTMIISLDFDIKSFGYHKVKNHSFFTCAVVI